jgi:hypothetical protein
VGRSTISIETMVAACQAAARRRLCNNRCGIVEPFAGSFVLRIGTLLRFATR